jgi:hypothetical protein
MRGRMGDGCNNKTIKLLSVGRGEMRAQCACLSKTINFYASAKERDESAGRVWCMIKCNINRKLSSVGSSVRKKLFLASQNECVCLC